MDMNAGLIFGIIGAAIGIIGGLIGTYFGIKSLRRKNEQKEECDDKLEKNRWLIVYWSLFVVAMMSLLTGAFVHKFSNTGLWQAILGCVVLLFCTQFFGMWFYRELKLQVLKESKQTQMMLVEILEKIEKKS
jgi:uncharacterized membrane-anchored protein